MSPRANLGIDRRPCDRCGHRRDMHVDHDDLLACVVCSNGASIWPCSKTRLDAERDAAIDESKTT